MTRLWFTTPCRLSAIPNGRSAADEVAARFQFTGLGGNRSFETLPASDETHERRENQLFISLASLWESHHQDQQGQYWLDEMRTQRFDLLPLRTDHLIALGDLEHHHRDPFDRLILAQATAERLPVITNDSVFGRYPVEVIW